MIKVFQQTIDKGNGDCMQACIASLLEKNLNDVPKFIEYKRDWFKVFYSYLIENGYEYNGTRDNVKYNLLFDPTSDCFKQIKYRKTNIIHKNCLDIKNSIDGFYFASVLSPGYTKSSLYNCTHAVIIDKDLNIIHDPNPNYNVKEFRGYPLRKLIGFNGIINISIINKTNMVNYIK